MPADAEFVGIYTYLFHIHEASETVGIFFSLLQSIFIHYTELPHIYNVMPILYYYYGFIVMLRVCVSEGRDVAELMHTSFEIR